MAARTVVRWLMAMVGGVVALGAQSALDEPGRFYQLRRELRQAAASTEELSVLRQAAEMEDLSGSAAPEAYARLATALQHSAARSDEYFSVLERGLTVSLRDNDPQRAEWFRERLRTARRQVRPATAKASAGPRNGVWIPGGRQALAFVARSKENSSPERFLMDYCRAIVEHTASLDRRATVYIERIQQHFRRVAALEALGTRQDNRVTVTVSGRGGRTETILNLLGWKIRSLGKGARMEADEKTPLGRRQESAVALAVDGVTMQQALNEGRPYSFDLVSDRTPVLLDENTWRRHFYAKEELPGGLAEALARDPRLARAYAALSALDEPTRSALLAGMGLKELVEKYAALLYQHSSVLVVENGSVLVPGGKEAEPFWEKLAGASPRRPGPFLRALLDRDQGRMLAFFFVLSHLDREHQRFSTRSAARLALFYELFREASVLHLKRAVLSPDNPWADLLREAPLDTAGRVRFPGSARVWMVAEGASSSPAKGAALSQKPGEPLTPEQEDQVLARLARTRYAVGEMKRSGLENFLAVARLEAHRSVPLTERAALLLAQNAAESDGAYPYFATLTGLGERDFERFFALRDKLGGYPAPQLDIVLGQVHALLELLCLAQQSAALDEKRAAALFALLCERFLAAESAADWTRASLDLVRRVIPAEAQDPDEAARALLLGQQAAVSFELEGVTHLLDVAKIRHTRLQRVLEAQHVPALSALLRIYDAAQALASGAGDAAGHLRALETAAAGLPSLELPQALRRREEREHLMAFQPKTVPILARLRERVGRAESRPGQGLGDRREVEGLVGELLAEINPQVTLALAGLLYARLLDPDGLLVSEDPLLLRKHQFVPLKRPRDSAVFRPPELHTSSEGAGSCFTGGFAAFSAVAGELAAAAMGQSDRSSAPAFAAQVASIREAAGAALRDEDLRLLGLKVRVGREWVVQGARDPAAASTLRQETTGLLSPGRRAELLNGVRAQDWEAVWQAVSLSDLYFLGDAYLQRHRTDPFPSPVTRALREASARNDSSRLQALGPQTRMLGGCSHVHLLPLAPYEEYERYVLPGKMAERVAEFKLYLAEYMDREGIPAAAFGALAEPVAEILFKKLLMTNLRDWRSVLAVFREINSEVIEEAVARL